MEDSVVNEHLDVWCVLWEGVWASEDAKVISAFVVAIESEDDEVPLEHVFWIWRTDEVVSYLAVLLNLGHVVLLDHFDFTLKSNIVCLHM